MTGKNFLQVPDGGLAVGRPPRPHWHVRDGPPGGVRASETPRLETRTSRSTVGQQPSALRVTGSQAALPGRLGTVTWSPRPSPELLHSSCHSPRAQAAAQRLAGPGAGRGSGLPVTLRVDSPEPRRVRVTVS
jgi:hypothetical protein